VNYFASLFTTAASLSGAAFLHRHRADKPKEENSRNRCDFDETHCAWEQDRQQNQNE